MIMAAYAQEVGKDSLAQDVLLEEFVFSAKKWKEPIQEVPNKVAVIGAGEIALQQPQTAADLLGMNAGVYVQKSQMGGGSPMIRGFAANRVLITVDGVRMNNAIFRSGNLQNVISVDPFIIENTEVIMGPGSGIYGSDAIGGVMNFTTLSPMFSSNKKNKLTTHIVSRYASVNNEKTIHADVNVGNKKWASLTSFTFSDFGNLRMGKYGPEEYLQNEYVEIVYGKDVLRTNNDARLQQPTAYQQQNFMQKFRYRANTNLSLDYGFYYTATTDVPRYDRLIEYKGDALKYAQWYYGPQKWMMHNLSLLHTKSNRYYDELRATVAYQFFEESRHDRKLNKTVLRHRTEQVGVTTVNMDLHKRWNKKQHLYYGAEFVHNTVGSEGFTEDLQTNRQLATSTRYPDGSTYATMAGYASYWQKLNKLFSVQAGVRYSYVQMHSRFDTAFFPFPYAEAALNTGALNGNLGLICLPAESWQLNFNYSSGFRAPNIDDMGKVFDSEPGNVVVPNPDLAPEYAHNFEFDVRKTFGHRAKLEVGVFYTRLTNALARRVFALDGKDSILYDGEMSRVYAVQNVADAYVYGVQADLELNFRKGWQMRSQLNWQKGMENEGEGSLYVPLRHASPLFTIHHLTYTRKKWKADLSLVYSGEIAYQDLAPSEVAKPHLYAVDDNGNPYCPAWYSLNLKANYKINKVFTVSGGLENITNQRYRTYSSGIVAGGRNYICSLKAAF